MKANSSTNVAVIGGGMAGIAAGIHLAREGRNVTVFERSTTPGGRGRSQEDQGFVMNLGPHALYPAAERELANLGVHVSGGRPSTRGIAVARGRRHILPSSPGTILRSGYLGARDKIRAGLAFKAVLGTDPATLRGRVLADWLQEIGGTERVRSLLETYFRLGTYADAPHLLDAEVALRQFQGGAGGVLYADGGWATIVDAMRAALESAGGEIRTGERVEAVVPADDGFHVRLSGGAVVAAGAVIVATPPKEAATLLDGVAEPAMLERLRSLIPAKAAVLDIGVSQLPRSGATLALGMDRPHYFQVHSAYAKLAQSGTHLMSVAMYLPVDKEVDAEAVRAQLEETVDIVQPGWRQFRITDRYLPSLTVLSALPVAGQRRPEADESGIPGLFFAGDWVGWDTMLADTSLQSARAAAALAAQHAPAQTSLAAAV